MASAVSGAGPKGVFCILGTWGRRGRDTAGLGSAILGRPRRAPDRQRGPLLPVRCVLRRFSPFLASAFLGLLAGPVWAPPADLESWFPRLRPGMWVEVEGGLVSVGVFVAKEIKILDGEPDEWQIETLVGTVDLPQLTLATRLGLRIVTTEKTECEGRKDEHDVSLADLAADDRVEVEGRLQKDGSLLADKIEIEKPVNPPKNEHELKARIEAVDADNRQVRLMGILVQCDEHTRIKTPFGN